MTARSHANRDKRLARLRALVTGENYQRALRAVRSDTIGAYVPLTTGVTAGTTRLRVPGLMCYEFRPA